MRKFLTAIGIMAALTTPAAAVVTYTPGTSILTAPFRLDPAWPVFPLLPLEYVALPKINLGALDVLDNVTVSAVFHSDNFFSVYNNTPSLQADTVSYYVANISWRIRPDLAGAPTFTATQGRPSNYANWSNIALDPTAVLDLPVHDHFDVVAGGVLDPSFYASFIGPSGSVLYEVSNTLGTYGGSGFQAMRWMSNLSTTGDVFVQYDYRLGTEENVPVPEPMTASAFLLGAGALAAVRRRARPRA
jgi:hypothetical protein